MINIKNYYQAESLEEAYLLNQKRSNVVLGGMCWLKMMTKNVQTVIDLSGLGLDQIEVSEDFIRLGAMCSLRQLEVHPLLEKEFQGAFKESLRHIVGVQFRNTATIGGSVFGRFGFSDILTCLLVLDSQVKLFRRGTIPLSEFVQLPRDNDILAGIIVPRAQRKVCYQSFRRTKTDFPILASAAAAAADKLYLAVGARPMRAELLTVRREEVPKNQEDLLDFAAKLADRYTYGSNMRGSAKYRRHLAMVSIRRAVLSFGEEFYAD